MIKTTRSDRKTGKRSRLRLQTLWAKPHRFSAHVTEEQDWHTEVPNVRLARVFGIVLILHIVAVGGILAFKMIERTSIAEESIPAAQPAPAASETGAPQGYVEAEEDINVIVDDPSRIGMKHYRVRSGDNLLAVARRLAVSVSELEELNQLNDGKSLYPGMVLLVPNRTISPVPPEEIQRLLGNPLPQQVVKAETSAPVPDAPEAFEAPSRPVAVIPAAGADPDPVVERPTVSKPVVLAAAPDRPEPSDLDALPVVKPAVMSGVPEVKPAPAPAPAPAPPAAAPRPTPAASSRYVVVTGDTCYAIARRFGLSDQALMKANGISDPRMLRIGQELVIPAD